VKLGLTLHKERKSRLYENKVMRTIFWPKRGSIIIRVII